MTHEQKKYWPITTDIKNTLGKSFQKLMTGWLYTLTKDIKRPVTFYYYSEENKWECIEEIEEYMKNSPICYTFRNKENNIDLCRTQDLCFASYSRDHHQTGTKNPDVAVNDYLSNDGRKVIYEVHKCKMLGLTEWVVPVIVDDDWLGAFITGQIQEPRDRKILEKKLKEQALKDLTIDDSLNPPTEDGMRAFFESFLSFVDYVIEKRRDFMTLSLKNIYADIEPYLKGEVFPDSDEVDHDKEGDDPLSKYKEITIRFQKNRTNLFEGMIFVRKLLNLQKLHVFKPRSSTTDIMNEEIISGAMLEVENIDTVHTSSHKRTRPFTSCNYYLSQEALREYFKLGTRTERMKEIIISDPIKISKVSFKKGGFDLPNFDHALLLVYTNNKYAMYPIAYLLFFADNKSKQQYVNIHSKYNIFSYSSALFLSNWYVIYADYHRSINYLMTQFTGHELGNILQGMKVETAVLDDLCSEITELSHNRNKNERELLNSLDDLVKYLRIRITGENRNNDLISIICSMTDSSLLNEPPDCRYFQPVDTLNGLVRIFTPLFHDQNRRIIPPKSRRNEYDYAIVENRQMNADDKLFQLIASNLINNAYKYSFDYTTTLVNFLFVPQENVHRLTVTSYGAFLSEEECTNVFEVGYRADDGIKAGKGMGLGLFLVKRFAELHGGKAYAMSAKVSKYHAPCLNLIHDNPREYSGLYTENEIQKFVDEYNRLRTSEHSILFYRSNRMISVHYVKQFIHQSTSCNSFVVDFPVIRGGRS